MEKQLEQIEKNSPSIVLVSVNGNELNGYLILLGNQMGRTRHSAKIVIGIHEKDRGKGIGTKLFQKMEEHARTNEIRRLELSVIANNALALSLYRKMGFEKGRNKAGITVFLMESIMMNIFFVQITLKKTYCQITECLIILILL
ncbi:GNAT family N-acetyltransferase [Peribacillus frigoritolerans]|nr:GNAT family N-acetyltransferase [Peribacillus frigoritolerans]